VVELSEYAGSAGAARGQSRSFVEKWICELLATRYRNRRKAGSIVAEDLPRYSIHTIFGSGHGKSRIELRRGRVWIHFGEWGVQRILR
jgi:hypothetical protein